MVGALLLCLVVGGSAVAIRYIRYARQHSRPLFWQPVWNDRGDFWGPGATILDEGGVFLFTDSPYNIAVVVVARDGAPESWTLDMGRESTTLLKGTPYEVPVSTANRDSLIIVEHSSQTRWEYTLEPNFAAAAREALEWEKLGENAVIDYIAGAYHGPSAVELKERLRRLRTGD